jgi:hypothetical protein
MRTQEAASSSIGPEVFGSDLLLTLAAVVIECFQQRRIGAGSLFA